MEKERLIPDREWVFGPFSMDVGRRVVRRGEQGIDLGDRAFSVLLTLIEHAGEVVDKRALLDAAWPDVAVGDNTLVQAVREIRSALGDDPTSPLFVQTAHRRGYRFVAAVEWGRVEADGGRPETAAAPSGRSRLPLRSLLWGVMLVSAAVLTFLKMRTTPPLPPFTTARMSAFQDLPDGAMKPAFSPNGDLLVAVVATPDDDVHSLWLVKPGAEAPLRLTHEIKVQGPSPAFNADGSAVLFTSYRNDLVRGTIPDVWEVSVLGGTPRRLVEGASGACQSPDGSQLVYAKVAADATRITVRSNDGSELVIAERGYWPRWSPDGNWIAYTTSNPEGSNGHLFVVRPDGSENRQLSSRTSQLYGLCWTPDSRWIIFGSDAGGPTDLWVVEARGGEPTLITRSPGESDTPSVSADGQRLVFCSGITKSAVYIAERPGEPMSRIMSQEQAESLVLSPDGRRLAVIFGHQTRASRLCIYDLDSHNMRPIGALDVGGVAWTPDGEELLVSAPSPEGDVLWVWRVPLDGGLPEPLVRDVMDWRWPDMSPDSRWLAGARRSKGISELVVVNLDTGNKRILHTAPEHMAVRWSPDGQWIAWSATPRPTDSLSAGVWAVRVDEGTVTRISADGAWVVWDPDGKDLIFARYSEHRGLWQTPVSGGPATRLYEPDDPMWDYWIYGLDIARGDSTLLVRLETAATGLYVLEEPDEG